tara:strand:- start:5553 stop:6485 length:933 start_codon:yes stop_codon:yes gene_type:complete
MPSYNFLKEAQVFVVYSGSKHQIDISSINFSQTFTEQSYSVKTLHNQKNLFDSSVINKANPANFDITFPLLKEGDFKTVFNLLVNYAGTTNKIRAFDLYISTELDVFKLETAVITNGSFVIERSRPLSLTVSGEASKLSYLGLKSAVTIPGSSVSRSATATYMMQPQLSVTLNSSVLSSIVSVTMEVQNNIDWNPYTTVHGALTTTSSANSMYPSDFTLKKRILGGSITAYVTEDKYSGGLALQSWDSSAPISIAAGEGSGTAFRGVALSGNCSFTNRVGSQAVFLQNFDWRLTDNPTDLGNILTYTTGA